VGSLEEVIWIQSLRASVLQRQSILVLVVSELLSRVVYEELGGDPHVLNSIDEFYTPYYISQPLWMIEFYPSFLSGLA